MKSAFILKLCEKFWFLNEEIRKNNSTPNNPESMVKPIRTRRIWETISKKIKIIKKVVKINPLLCIIGFVFNITVVNNTNIPICFLLKRLGEISFIINMLVAFHLTKSKSEYTMIEIFQLCD